MQPNAIRPGLEVYEAPPPDRLESRPANLADLLFRTVRPVPREDDSSVVLMGTLGPGPLDISLKALRSSSIRLADEVASRGLKPGDTICLPRLPRTSETLVAAAYVALSAAGMRVFLPMYLEPAAFGRWLTETGSKAVVWNAAEVLCSARHEGDRRLLDGLMAAAAGAGVPTWCLQRDLRTQDALQTPHVAAPEEAWRRINRLIGSTDEHTECLLLTTSGSSSSSKLVRYRQGAFLRSCASWESAGLFRRDRLGGRGLCLLLCHSMGIRALWNAVWTGQPICLIPPEWFLEHPERVHTLLQRMQPEHLTGGPASFHALLELVRVFPDMKDTCLRHFRCAVSSGATFDRTMARRLEAALGVQMENAFGMTETLQTLSTLVRGPFSGGLGNPLPGVKIGLQPLGNDDPNLHRLFVSSPFGFAGYLDENQDPFESAEKAWFRTGDIVRKTSEGIEYVDREDTCITKDGFGVKVSRVLVAERYAALGEPVVHVEPFPLRDEPGLAALVFLEAPLSEAAADEDFVTDRHLLDRVQMLLEARLERLQNRLEDFEIRHLTISRFACVNAEVPRTVKGNISRSEIESRFAVSIERLTARFVQRSGLVRIDRDSMLRPGSTRFSHPKTGELLRAARMDKIYEEATGDRLFYNEGDGRREVVDYVGGFGTNLLGHRHPEVVDAAREALEGPGPFTCDQGSIRQAEGAFARELAAAVGQITGNSYVVKFGSTGSEAVEMAIAHAFLAADRKIRRFTRKQRRLFGREYPERVDAIEAELLPLLRVHRPVVLALEGSFHGHTLAARSLQGHARKRSRFSPLMGLEVAFLRLECNPDLDRLYDAYRCDIKGLAVHDGKVVEQTFSFSRIIAAIAEPVQGEGGIRVVDRELLLELSEQDFPLILDEIQCGLGRTGHFLASEGIRGDYYLFGKALGGGVAKISALLIDRAQYVQRFDEYYVSTFAGDSFSCTVGRRVLEVIDRQDIPARARSRGYALGSRLEQVANRYPSVVHSVQGLGLMLGFRLALGIAGDSFLLRMIAEREHLGLLASSYLLNEHGLRLLPSLSAPNTLRVEPSVFIDDEAIERLGRGLESLCRALFEKDLRALLRSLVDDDLALKEDFPRKERLPRFSGSVESPAGGAIRVGFLNHFVFPEREMAFVEPSLRSLPPGARRALFHRMVGLMEMQPSVCFTRNLFNGRVWFASIVIPADTATLEDLHRSGRRRRITDRIQDGVELAHSLGCQVVGLGAHTSILTNNGLTLSSFGDVHLTTGNTLTVAAGDRRLARLVQQAGIDASASGTRLAVVGATGNIGTALIHRFLRPGQPWRHLVLVGRDRGRLEQLEQQLRHQRISRNGTPSVGTPPEIEVSTDLSALRSCNVILMATNTNETLLMPHHIDQSRRTLIADLSLPYVVSGQVRQMPNVRLEQLFGTVRVPGEPDFSMASHISPGTAFSCAAETMILALEPEKTRALSLVGGIDPANVELLDRLAARHGFYGRQNRKNDVNRLPWGSYTTSA